MVPHTNSAYNASTEFAERFRSECTRAWSLVQAHLWTPATAQSAWETVCAPFQSSLPYTYEVRFLAPEHLLERWTSRCVSLAWRLPDLLHSAHADIHVECATEHDGVWKIHLQHPDGLKDNAVFWKDNLSTWLGYMVPASDWVDCGVSVSIQSKVLTSVFVPVHP